jgi:calcineurin-like phosphoesterase family protein
MNYFSSDLHLNKNSKIDLDNRPFKNSQKFDNYIIKLWNKTTTKDDVIYLIGDFLDYHNDSSSFWQKSLLLVKKLKAKVVLIIGNNEERVIKNHFNDNFESFRKYCIEIGFMEVYKNHIINILDREFYLVHKYKEINKNYLNLFGHSHRAIGLYTPYGFNVGCDLNHFRLYSENDIAHLLYMKNEYWDKDANINKLLNDK